MTSIRNDHVKTRLSPIPVWVKLGVAGFGSLALAHWAPAVIDPVLIVAGFVMLLGAIIGLRLWVSELVPRAQLIFEIERFSRPAHDRVPLWSATETEDEGERAELRHADHGP